MVKMNEKQKDIIRLVKKINRASQMIDDAMEEFIVEYETDQKKIDAMIQLNVDASMKLMRMKHTMRFKATQLKDK